MSNRSQQQAARALADATPGLKYTTALRQVMGESSPVPASLAKFDFDCVDGSGYRIPFATDSQGDPVFFDPQEHLLVIGGTGSGRTVASRAVIYGLLAGGAELYVVNSTRGLDLEFAERYTSGFADNISDTLLAMEYVRTEIGRRSRLLGSHGVPEIADLPAGVRPEPLFIMVDEFASLSTKHPVVGKDTAAEALARQEIIALAGSIAREGRAAGVTLLVDAQRVGAAANGLKENTSHLLLGRQSQQDRDAALRDAGAADIVPQGAPMGAGIWEPQDRPGAAVQAWFATQAQFAAELAKRRKPLNLIDKTTIPAELKAMLSNKVLASPSTSDLEKLFASNSRVNKTLWSTGERTPLRVSPVSPFLEIGDVLTYYNVGTWLWTVVSQSKNFTILVGKDGEGKPVSTTIDWRNGWRTHNDWRLEPLSENGRAAVLEKLESLEPSEWEVGGGHDWHLDIKTVRRNKKLIIRAEQKEAGGTPAS